MKYNCLSHDVVPSEEDRHVSTELHTVSLLYSSGDKVC